MQAARSAGLLCVGVLVGVAGLGSARLLLQPPAESVHYHANWALWIDGKRVDFSADHYMEDVAACSADPSNIAATQRVHLHENNPDVIHVHHAGATWGHLMQNLGWGLGSDWLLTDTGELFRDDDERRFTFVLNELTVPPANNRVIQPGDRLLISIGSDASETAMGEQFSSVASNAPEFDAGFDPAGCQGSGEETLRGRLRRAFWF